MKKTGMALLGLVTFWAVQKGTAQKIQFAGNILATNKEANRPIAPALNTMKGKALNSAIPANKVNKIAAHPTKKITVGLTKLSKPPNTAKHKNKTLFGVDSITNAVKGNLQLPLASCTVAQFFGHTNMGSFKLYNPGITFISPAPMAAKACYDALVEMVVEIEGMYVVITSCKNLYMGYSNLEEVFVKKGDSVTTGKPLGTIAMDETGNYTLLFLLQVAEQEINPQYWFTKEATSALIKKEW